MLLDAKVGTIPQPDAKAPGSAPKAPLQMRGELTVVAGDERFHRHQLTKGEQSEALRLLVTRILEFSEKAAAGGVQAASLQDGLAKVGDGTLAPEAFTAFVRRADDREPARGRQLPPAHGRTPRLRPHDAEGRGPAAPPGAHDLGRRLPQVRPRDPEQDPATFAKTTYAPTYTDVTVTVLDYDKNVPARPYLDVTPETHGEKQKAFDRTYTLFRELHERVQKRGRRRKWRRRANRARGRPWLQLRNPLPRQNREDESDHAHPDEQPARRFPAVGHRALGSRGIGGGRRLGAGLLRGGEEKPGQAGHQEHQAETPHESPFSSAGGTCRSAPPTG